jgi:hypothetical protein
MADLSCFYFGLGDKADFCRINLYGIHVSMTTSCS